MLCRLVPIAVLVAVLAASCGGGGEAGGLDSADAGAGKELFVEGCGSCHTLAEAGTQGTIGPNLDEAFGYSREQGFDESTIFAATKAQIDIPRNGSAMPADIYKGQDAIDVAAYVASVAGQGIAGETGAAGG